MRLAEEDSLGSQSTCTTIFLRKILAIFLPSAVKSDTMGPCLILQAIYMGKLQGILWFVLGFGCLSFFQSLTPF